MKDNRRRITDECENKWGWENENHKNQAKDEKHEQKEKESKKWKKTEEE